MISVFSDFQKSQILGFPKNHRKLEEKIEIAYRKFPEFGVCAKIKKSNVFLSTLARFFLDVHRSRFFGIIFSQKFIYFFFFHKNFQFFSRGNEIHDFPEFYFLLKFHKKSFFLNIFFSFSPEVSTAKLHSCVLKAGICKSC